MPRVPAVALVLMSTLAAVTPSTFAADDLADRFAKKTFTGADGGTLNYREFIPTGLEAGKKYPLVVFLHGAGERGDDNTAQLIHGVKNFVTDAAQKASPCFVIAPQCPKDQTWASIDRTQDKATLKPEPSAPLSLVLQLIDRLQKDHPIDADRLYITGLSMGGYGTWDLLMRHPDKFAAGVPVCGGGDVSRADAIATIPIWVYHGAKDEAVPVERSRELVDALKAAGGKPHYTEYPEVGHDSWNGAYADAEMMAWLFQQKRPAR